MSITLKNISYHYEDGRNNRRPVLKDITLEIKEGEFVGIAGHTGSGKSTLIQHLNGLLTPDHGSVCFDGTDVHARDYDIKKLRGEVGMCFQYPEHQLFEVTVLDDVCFGPMNFGLNRQQAQEAAVEALSQVGLKEAVFHKSPFELSGGQQRRAAIAGVLAMKPKYFILDEPTAGLDPEGRQSLLKLLERLHREDGITVILVSHSMEDLAAFAQRIIVMDQGKILFDDEKRSVFSHWKELKKIGLDVPYFKKLAYALRKEGFEIRNDVLTLEETKEEILSSLKEKGILKV